MPTGKRKRAQLLSNSRVKQSTPRPKLSAATTRSIVRSHHTLRKQLQHAVANKDEKRKGELEAQLEAQGGLKRYQEASILGQSVERGGDSSKVLVGWLHEYGIKKDVQKDNAERTQHGKLRMLEVGALKIDNACSKSGIFEMERIDLHSQHCIILEQDFMLRPLPRTLESDGFDVVSLSLVVNFVDSATGRGAMLDRVASFLRPASPLEGTKEAPLPSLFLVLPAPCVTNSRYLDEARLTSIMTSLGYSLLKSKMSAKLVYYLWRFDGKPIGQTESFKKKELRGGLRNNFAIVL